MLCELGEFGKSLNEACVDLYVQVLNYTFNAFQVGLQLIFTIDESACYSHDKSITCFPYGVSENSPIAQADI